MGIAWLGGIGINFALHHLKHPIDYADIEVRVPEHSFNRATVALGDMAVHNLDDSGF